MAKCEEVNGGGFKDEKLGLGCGGGGDGAGTPIAIPPLTPL